MKQKEQQEAEKGHKNLPLNQKVLAFLKEFGIVFGAFLVLNNFVVASFLVPTGSMENEVMTGDFLFVNKFIYGGTSPRNILFTNIRLPWFRVPAIRDVERGDVIVFVFPGYRDEVESDEFTFYLKRCVAIAGDTLQIVNRVLYVNGVPAPLSRNMKFNYPNPMPASQIDERIFPLGASWNEDFYGPIIIPKKGMSIPLATENLKAWETFIRREGHQVGVRNGEVVLDGVPASSYVVERDYLFGMGDHRDNSLDSRYWGFIPKENLVGTPILVYWSWDSDAPIYNIIAKLGSVRLNRIGTFIR